MAVKFEKITFVKDLRNQFLESKVIKNVLRFLPKEDLLSARLVCKEWNSKILPLIRDDITKIIMFNTIRQAKQFLSVFRKSSNPPFGRIEFQLEILRPKFVRRLSFIGHSVTHLEIQTSEQYAMTEMDIIFIPEFETMDFETVSSNSSIIRKASAESMTDFPDHFKTRNVINIHYKFNKGVNTLGITLPQNKGVKCEEFLSALFQTVPNLKIINFNSAYQCLEVSECVMNALKALSLQSSIFNSLEHINFNTSVNIKSFETLQTQNVRLKTLKIQELVIENGVDGQLFEKFLASVSETLEYLEIRRIYEQPTKIYKISATENVITFPIMEKLTQVRLIDGTDDSFAGRDLKIFGDFNYIINPSSINHLPVLEKLYLDEKCSDILCPKRTLSNSLKFLEVEFAREEEMLYDSNWIKGIPSMFPKLTTLHLWYIGKWNLKTICQYMTTLEHLNIITIKDWVVADPILTGISERACRKFLQEPNKDEVIGKYLEMRNGYRNPSICNLKNLKSLTISSYYATSNTTSFHISQNHQLTDATGYLCLLQLNPLEYLEINGAQLTLPCIQKLEDYHGTVEIPNVAVGS